MFYFIVIQASIRAIDLSVDGDYLACGMIGGVIAIFAIGSVLNRLLI